MKKLLATLLLSSLLFTACGSDEEAASTSSSGTTTEASTANEITVVYGSEPETMDPVLNSASDVASTLAHLFEGLVTFDQEGNIVPGVAESWEISEDGMTYTFHLREDAKWSNGEPITAHDFVYSWQRAVDPDTASSYAFQFYYIEGAQEIYEEGAEPSTLGVTAIDDHTLQVQLVAPTPYFLGLTGFGTYYPVNQTVVEADPEGWTLSPETYISNGPYMLAEWNHDESIVMVKNPNYWNAENVTGPDQITALLMDDPNSIESAYRTGEVQYAEDIPAESYEYYEELGELVNTPTLSLTYISFNVNEPPLDDVRVRQALSLAIDRTYICETVIKTNPTPAGGAVPYGVADYNGEDFRDVAGGELFDVSAAAYEQNVAKAQQLMADAGYPGGEGFPTTTVILNDSGQNKELYESIQYMWQETLGVTVNLEMQEWAVLTENRATGNFQIARDGWNADYNDPMTFLDLFYSTSGNNNPHYANPEYDALIDAARVEPDTAVRSDLLHQAEYKLVVEDCVIAPLYYGSDIAVCKPELTGVVTDVYGHVNFTHAQYTPAE